MNTENSQQAKDVKELYRRLISEYGLSGWWEAEDPEEILCGVLLSQGASHQQALTATAELKKAKMLDLRLWRQSDGEQIACVLEAQGVPPQNALLLKNVAMWLLHYQDSFSGVRPLGQSAIRAALLGINGLQPATADMVLLYVLDYPVFIADENTRLLLQRLGWLGEDASYEQTARYFTDVLPRLSKFYNEFHALISRHAQNVCKEKPLCDFCVLKDMCAYAKALDK